MTLQEVFDIVDILQDKYGAPYFPTDWKVKVFNQAQRRYVNTLIPDNQGGEVNMELDSNTLQNLKPLIYTVSVNTNSGLLSNSNLETVLAAASHAGAKPRRLLAIRATDDNTNFYPVRFARYNNIWAFFDNSFKRPVAPHKMRWSPVATGYQFYPTSDTTNLLVTVLKDPRDVSISPAVAPEWDNHVISYILVEMLKLLGIATRDEELITQVRGAIGQ